MLKRIKMGIEYSTAQGWLIVLSATFNNISVILWRSVLLVEETGENHRPIASHWQTLAQNVY